MSGLFRNKLLILAGTAFLARLIFVLIFPGGSYFDGISNSYTHVAENILQGRGMVTLVDTAPLSSPEPNWNYVPFIDRPIGYLLLLLVPYALFAHPVSIQVLHAMLSALTAISLYRVGQRIVSENASWRAALVYALWPLSARFEIAALPDAVMPFFLVLTLWLLLRGLTERSLKWYLLTGISSGIGMTMRPDILFLPLFLIVGMFLLKSAQGRRNGAALVLVGVGIVVGAHTIRNYGATEGRILPLGLGNGISMWEGISQFGDTLGTLYGDDRLAKLEGYRAWAYPDGIERDRKRFQDAIGIISSHPLWYAEMMLKRIPVLLTPDWIMTRKFAPSLKEYLAESAGNNAAHYFAHYPVAALIRIALVFLQYVTLALALFALLRDRGRRLLWFPALLIFYYIVIHIPTNTEARYFYPAIPLVLLLASHGWELIARRRSAQKE